MELGLFVHILVQRAAVCKIGACLRSQPSISVNVDYIIGSGSTIIAAERQGRTCYAMEVEPRYVDMAVARWEQYTGEKAELWE